MRTEKFQVRLPCRLDKVGSPETVAKDRDVNLIMFSKVFDSNQIKHKIRLVFFLATLYLAVNIANRSRTKSFRVDFLPEKFIFHLKFFRLF